MTEQQETRIKLLKDFTKIDFSNPMGWTGYYDTELKELSQAVETALNMLKQKDKTIESKDRLILITGRELDDAEQECEKKDKIIDLMAKYIACLDNDETICKKFYSGNICEDKNIVCWECVKQYFGRKVKE